MTLISQLLESVTHIARDAGSAILARYNDPSILLEKAGGAGPLTEADMASHRLIVNGLRALTPEQPILSEESESIDFSTRSQWHRYWLVDPLDGTKEFLTRNGEFTVNIALIENHRPILGVVYAPVLDILYFAEQGYGAFKQRGADTPVPLQVSRHKTGEPWRVVGSRSHLNEETSHFVAGLGPHEFIAMGSSLKLCLVAEGRAHLYPRLGPTSEWDTAAAQCVVEQAGGQVLDTVSLKPLEYNAKESILNPFFIVCVEPDEVWKHHIIKAGSSSNDRTDCAARRPVATVVPPE